MQNQSTAVFPSRSTIGKIETIPQMGMTLKNVRAKRDIKRAMLVGLRDQNYAHNSDHASG